MSETETHPHARGPKDLAVAAAVPDAAEPRRSVRAQARCAGPQSYATGRRKNAIARVWVKPGKGEITVNGKRVGEYFARPVLRMLITQPFLVTDRYNQFDVILHRAMAAASRARLVRCGSGSAGR